MIDMKTQFKLMEQISKHSKTGELLPQHLIWGRYYPNMYNLDAQLGNIDPGTIVIGNLYDTEFEWNTTIFPVNMSFTSWVDLYITLIMHRGYKMFEGKSICCFESNATEQLKTLRFVQCDTDRSYVEENLAEFLTSRFLKSSEPCTVDVQFYTVELYAAGVELVDDIHFEGTVRVITGPESDDDRWDSALKKAVELTRILAEDKDNTFLTIQGTKITEAAHELVVWFVRGI